MNQNNSSISIKSHLKIKWRVNIIIQHIKCDVWGKCEHHNIAIAYLLFTNCDCNCSVYNYNN